jgi:ribosomal protein S14
MLANAHRADQPREHPQRHGQPSHAKDQPKQRNARRHGGDRGIRLNRDAGVAPVGELPNVGGPAKQRQRAPEQRVRSRSRRKQARPTPRCFSYSRFHGFLIQQPPRTTSRQPKPCPRKIVHASSANRIAEKCARCRRNHASARKILPDQIASGKCLHESAHTILPGIMDTLALLTFARRPIVRLKIEARYAC